MSKVITFSKTFPSNHPRKGEPTYFVEKIWKWWIYRNKNSDNWIIPYLKEYLEIFNYDINYANESEKLHTIRLGQRWKVGDKFSPRVWTGKPYNSKQIVIAPDMEVVKVYDFNKDLLTGEFHLNGKPIPDDLLAIIAENDGLTVEDFKAWFPKPFASGQIIFWSKDINYLKPF